MIKTRIAPSPTGKMHVGTARTALFNKLFALHHGGTYCVRIEDTDKERSTPENIDFIKEALTWLDLQPDDGYVLQSDNIQSHKDAANKLLDDGKAYIDDGAVRFKIPDGHTVWEDMVQGKITVEHKQLEDFVLLRSDGTPTYHLGVVVDDAAMGITHVMRGDDHINNTPKQILLHQALAKTFNHTVPHFAHIPLIYGEDGSKLSKRHGAVSVQEFQELGMLPNAMNHYMMMLSWLGGEDTAQRTLAQAGEAFNVADISKNPAQFDVAKLTHVNALYLREMDNISLLPYLKPYFTQHNWEVGEVESERLIAGLQPLKERASTLKELAEGASAYVRPLPFAYSPEEQTQLADAKPHLEALYTEFSEAAWDVELLQQTIKDYVKDNGLKFPAVGKPLRLALIGASNGPGLNDIFKALGQTETLNRLKLAF